MDTKKISFGFSKLTKKTNIISLTNKIEEKKVELIDCLEGKTIKIKDVVEEIDEPLIIPLKDNQKNLLDRIREKKKKEENGKAETDTRPDSELTPDELAAKELIREAKNRLTSDTSNESKLSVLPIKPEELSLEGEKEPTLDDYESIPVADYGLALLRGMGWKEGMPIGKNVSKNAVVNLPELRPKGLGLGASKMVEAEKGSKKAVDKNGKELALVKGGHGKIIAGPQKGNYCEVQGFDEEAGRVIVRSFPKMEVLNINEFMIIPVTKDEFSRGSKVLNNAKYEEYKEMSDRKLEKHKANVKKEYKSDEDVQSSAKKYEKNYSKSSSSKKYDSSESDDSERRNLKSGNIKHERRCRSRSISKSRNRHNKYDSDSSDSDTYYKKEKKSHKSSKAKQRHRSRSNDRYKKNKKHKSKSRKESASSDDPDYKKTSKKRDKSKHKRRGSSSENDSRHSRRYK